MKCELLNSKVTTIILVLLFVILCLFIKLNTKTINTNNNIILQDTTYNTIVLDSIKYNITIKDSIITKIKYKYETEIIKVDNMSDSASVKLFKELCTSDSLYGGNNTIR